LGATANVSSQGTGTIGTDMFLLFTSGADGAFVESISFQHTASAANTAGNATVINVFLSSISSGATTGANSRFLGAVLLPAQTAASTTAPVIAVVLSLNIRIPATSTIIACQSTAPAVNTAVSGLVVAGDF
jgi:hypothetical protein